MERLAYEAVPYDREEHEAFVRSSWCSGANKSWEPLAARLRRPDTLVIVAHLPDDPDSLLGWVAVDVATGAVVWLYVRELYGKVRRRGLGTALLLIAGVDPSQPTPCLYWSPYAAILAARGYRFFYQPRKAKHEVRNHVHTDTQEHADRLRASG